MTVQMKASRMRTSPGGTQQNFGMVTCQDFVLGSGTKVPSPEKVLTAQELEELRLMDAAHDDKHEAASSVKGSCGEAAAAATGLQNQFLDLVQIST